MTKSELEITAIAKVAYQANKAWCEAHGDLSQRPWPLAGGWQRDSVIDGVRFHLENPDADEAASHDNWMKHRIADGWVYGEVKDPVAKTHPCLVPFEDLPKHQQAKDRLFRAIVHALR